MSRLSFILIVLLVGCAGVMLWVRFSSIDPGKWHEDLTSSSFVPPRNAAAFCRPADRRVSFGADSLAALDDIAIGWPRTKRIAGSVEEGHITWVTRSVLFGYPDFTTAQIRGDRLCVIARQGIGLEDFGVNAKRLGAWLQTLGGLNEVPDLIWE